MSDSKKYTSIHYHNYLELDKLLGAQVPRSGKFEDKPAHDEILFIIMHQVYELWFKQIIHELDSVSDMFRDKVMDEERMNMGVLRLKRVSEILELVIKQIFVMETLTPLDFLDFRNYLFPASGFQSLQFRVIESMLGLREEDRLTYNGHSYKIVFSDEQKEHLTKVEERGSLFELIEQWLERIPFLKFNDFNFLTAYKDAVEKMLAREEKGIQETDYLSPKMKEMRLKMLGGTNTYFKQVLSEEEHNKLIEKGEMRLSYKATLAALLINLYREKPILTIPYNFIMELMNIDELLTTWRYRHAQMVMRMIGNKVGTGGSSGHDYLAATAEKHKVFKDLHNISSLLIPRSDLPDLPLELSKELSFYYTESKA
jgi:tryptophan 2,3-dioxygenase